MAIPWQRISNFLFYHAEKKQIFILICKLCQQSNFLKTQEQCIRICIQINFKLGGIPLQQYTQNDLLTVLKVGALICKNMQQFNQQNQSIKRFKNNFELFCQIMNLLIKILQHIGTQAPQINQQIVKFIQNYCQLIMDQSDEEKLQQYGEKLRQYQRLFGKQENMLLLLTGAPARIINIFGGQKIIQNVLAKMQMNQLPTISSLLFLNHISQRFVMLPSNLMKSIGQFFMYTYRISQAKKTKFYAFSLLCKYYAKHKANTTIICNIFQQGLQYLIQGWNRQRLNNEEKQLVQESMDILLQINSNENISKLCLQLLQKCIEIDSSNHIIFCSNSASTILCQYIAKSLQLNTISSLSQQIIQQGMKSNNIIGEQIALQLVRRILSKANQFLAEHPQSKQKIGQYFNIVITESFVLFMCKYISSQPPSKQGNLQEFFMDIQSNKCPYYTTPMINIAGIISELILYDYQIYQQIISICLNCLIENSHYCAIFFQLISFLILQTHNLQASNKFRKFLISQQDFIRKKQYMLNVKLIQCNQQDFRNIQLIEDEKIVNRINLRLWQLQNDSSSIEQMLKKLQVSDLQQNNKNIQELAKFPYNWCQKISMNLYRKLKQDKYYDSIYYMRKLKLSQGQ